MNKETWVLRNKAENVVTIFRRIKTVSPFATAAILSFKPLQYMKNIIALPSRPFIAGVKIILKWSWRFCNFITHSIGNGFEGFPERINLNIECYHTRNSQKNESRYDYWFVYVLKKQKKRYESERRSKMPLSIT